MGAAMKPRETTLRRLARIHGISAILLVLPAIASAQYLGGRAPGDSGLQAGTQPDPGVYLSMMYLRYDSDTLRNRYGDSIRPLADSSSVAVNAFSFGVSYVSSVKILGANPGLMVFPAFTDNKLEAPILGRDLSTSFGVGDLYFQPINLGWHTKRADFLTGMGVYAPTGSYEPDAADNLGLGMWGFEFFGGTTLYFDEARAWHVATTAFYETHTEKKGTDLRVGDIVTLQGGVGRSFLEGLASVGLAYYAQWKVTDDDLGADVTANLGGRGLGKHRGYGVGPELTFPVRTKTRLLALVNARYLWETGVRTNLEGQLFMITMTIPIPSGPLP